MNKILIGLVLLLTVGLATQTYRVNQATKEIQRVVLIQDSLQATIDTTRIILDNYQDSLVVSERRVVQQTQRADELDELLSIERRAKADLSLKVDSLNTLVSGTTRTDSGPDTVVADFEGYTQPYTYSATATIPLNVTLQPSLALQIATDPANIGVRLGCRPSNVREDIKSAVISLTTPSWLTATVDSVSQSPEVCNPTLELFEDSPPFYKRWWFIAGASAVVTSLLIN